VYGFNTMVWMAQYIEEGQGIVQVFFIGSGTYAGKHRQLPVEVIDGLLIGHIAGAKCKESETDMELRTAAACTQPKGCRMEAAALYLGRAYSVQPEQKSVPVPKPTAPFLSF
jgi:sulfur relay (sulfurtransferase) complex TusBCD TusD component (DsrE family)